MVTHGTPAQRCICAPIAILRNPLCGLHSNCRMPTIINDPRSAKPRQYLLPVVLTGLAAGAFLAWRAASRHERSRLMRSGEIAGLHSQYFHINRGRIHARLSNLEDTQAGLPVVFVHGWGVSGGYFTPLAEQLACAFPVFVPDLPGHGLSDTPPEALDMACLAQALVDSMDRAGIARASLIGHSMGCQIAVEAAHRHPERIARLVLIGPAPGPPGRGTVEQAVRLALGSPYERFSIIMHLARDYLRMGLRLIPEFRFMMRHRMEDTLPRIRLPTMLVVGEHDWIVPQRWLSHLSTLIQLERSATIPGEGHGVHYSAPEKVAEAIAPFLREAN